MLKDTSKTEAFDDIPMNSPEYLKRFQCSFNPAFVQDNKKPIILSSYLTGSNPYLSSFLGGSFYKGSLYIGSFGSFYGSGSYMFCGLGYGIDLI